MKARMRKLSSRMRETGPRSHSYLVGEAQFEIISCKGRFCTVKSTPQQGWNEPCMYFFHSLVPEMSVSFHIKKPTT